MTTRVRLLIFFFAMMIGLALRPFFEKEEKDLGNEANSFEEKTIKQQIIAFGDSVTAGYQLSPEESYPAQLQLLLEQTGYDLDMINAGKSGDTSSQMRDRFDRSLAGATSGDILLLCAGANDGLQGLSLEQLEKNILWMISQAQEKGIQVVLAGMQIPPNYGESYSTQFAAIYPRVAASKQIALFPFLLEGVAAVPTLNLSDAIHPNAAGYTFIAKNIFDFLEKNKLIKK